MNSHKHATHANDKVIWTCEVALQGHDAPIFMSQSHETCHIVARSPMRPALKLYRLPHAPQCHVRAHTPAANYSTHARSHTDAPHSGHISNDALGMPVFPHMWSGTRTGPDTSRATCLFIADTCHASPSPRGCVDLCKIFTLYYFLTNHQENLNQMYYQWHSLNDRYI